MKNDLGSLEEIAAVLDERQRAYEDAVKVANGEKAKRIAAEDDMAAIAADRDAWGERAIRAEAALKVSDQRHHHCIDKLHTLRAGREAVWDAGFNAGHYLDGEERNCGCGDNPYRPGGGL